MRHRSWTVLLTAFALTFGVAACTESTGPVATSPTSSSSSGGPTAGESPGPVDPASSGNPDGGDTSLTQAEAKAALDEAIAAIDKQGSIGFTSRGENVINDEVTKISGSGAWTKNPLAWSTTTTYDRPDGRNVLTSPDQTTELIYVESTPEGPYVKDTYPDLPPRWQTDVWILIPGYGVREGVTKKDVSTPPDVRMLVETDASAGSVLGVSDTITISGTFPTPWALDALDLTEHVSDLGLANRFEDSTTRVLVIIGADGLPQTLQFTGTGIGRPEEGLPDYVVEELAGARYLVEYGDAKLDGPIKAPDPYVRM